MTRLVIRAMGALLALVLAGASCQRIKLLADFQRNFGSFPEHPCLASWLENAEAPSGSGIISSLQSYVPKKYERFISGVWEPRSVEEFLFGAGAIPSVYIEDASYFDSHFSKHMAVRHMANQAQVSLYASGRELFSRLETNQARPFILAHFGSETADTNLLLPARRAPAQRILIYANRFAFASNLMAEAVCFRKAAGREDAMLKPFSEMENSPARFADALEFRWRSPVTVKDVHAGLRSPAVPGLCLALLASDGRIIREKMEPPCMKHYRGGDTERFVFLAEPVECSSMSIAMADGKPLDLAGLREMEALAPAPLGLNPTGAFFEAAGEDASEWGKAAGLKPLPEDAALLLEPGSSRTFSFQAKAGCPAAVDELLVVFAGEVREADAECRLGFADGMTESVRGKLLRSACPAVSWLSFPCGGAKAASKLGIRIDLPAHAAGPARLIQVAAHLSPVSNR